MKKAQLFVLAAAVMAAGGAGYLAMNLSAPEPAPQVAAQPQRVAMTQVLVAKSDIKMGVRIAPDMIVWKEWPRSSVAQGFITKSASPDAKEETVGAIARMPIYAGEPLRDARLVKSEKGFMSAILPKGQRAVATSISTATSAGGFILPNDRVDVLMTRRLPNGQGGFTTEVILENVRVLAINQTIQEKDGQQVIVGETATLQLSPKEVEILAIAQQTADRLSLALRSIADANEPVSKVGDHLLEGNKGTVRVIRYGAVRETTPRSSKGASDQGTQGSSEQGTQGGLSGRPEGGQQ